MEAKQIRNLVIMVLVLAALTAAYFLARSYTREQEEAQERQTGKESVDIAALSENGIVNLKYTFTAEDGEKTSVDIEKKEDVWYNGSVSLNSYSLNTMEYDLTGLKASRVLEGGDINLPEFGLESPSLIIEASDTAGVTQKISVGIQNGVTGEYYCILNDDKSKVYMVSGSLGTDFSKKADELL